MKSPAAAAASLAAGVMVGGPLVAASVGGGASDPSAPSPTVGTTTAATPPTVPRTEYERVKRKSWKRLQGWRRAERQRERLKRAMRWRIDYVAAGLRCIHTFEGSWTDSGDPYWGGLQMDVGFQRTYGAPLMERYGLANRWPAEAQIAVGTVAYYSGRGFGPWPTTRRGCGL